MVLEFSIELADLAFIRCDDTYLLLEDRETLILVTSQLDQVVDQVEGKLGLWYVVLRRVVFLL